MNSYVGKSNSLMILLVVCYFFFFKKKNSIEDEIKFFILMGSLDRVNCLLYYLLIKIIISNWHVHYYYDYNDHYYYLITCLI